MPALRNRSLIRHCAIETPGAVSGRKVSELDGAGVVDEIGNRLPVHKVRRGFHPIRPARLARQREVIRCDSR